MPLTSIAGAFTLNRENPPGYETFWVSNNTHNALVTLGPDYEIVPDLAKSWEIIDQGKEYVFHLHENVKFHDGTECDAEAVKWNFDDMLDQGLQVLGLRLLYPDGAVAGGR